jgi:aspartokinase/homoserine dehydrogenase 1
MKVMKFGGSVLHHEAGFQSMIDIVKKEQDKNIIVISAFSDITRRLNTMMEHALHISYEHALETEQAIKYYHAVLAELLLPNNVAFATLLEDVSRKLQRLLKGISLTKEISPRIRDLILSQGEVLATTFIKELLLSKDIRVGLVDAGDIITTTSDHGHAKPIESLISHHVFTLLMPMFQDCDSIIIGGFIGKDSHGEITTMGYESSNLTAALLGSILEAEEITIWTDVSGIRSADPKYIMKTIGIPHLEYAQAQELADNGLKLLHHWMLDLPMQYSIPVCIANAFDEMGEKTFISNLKSDAIGTIIISHALNEIDLLNSNIAVDEHVMQLSVFTTDSKIIHKMYELATELSLNTTIIIRTYTSENMHQIIIDEKDAEYFMKSLHTLLEVSHETSS